MMVILMTWFYSHTRIHVPTTDMTAIDRRILTAQGAARHLYHIPRVNKMMTGDVHTENSLLIMKVNQFGRKMNIRNHILGPLGDFRLQALTRLSKLPPGRGVHSGSLE